MTRRQAVAGYASLLSGSPLLDGQRLAGEPPGRIAPVEGLVNTFEFEAMAQRKLDASDFAEIAGSDRVAFDRITFQPRLMVDTTRMDLSAELFGQSLFTPILVGPVSRQKRFHPEGELATVRGASAAKAVMVVADQSSIPVEELAAQAKTPLWYQVYLEQNMSQVLDRVQRAVKAGCKAVCVTMGAPEKATATAGLDWSALEHLRRAINVPVLLKGVMSPDEAQKAAGLGLQGIVVSSYAPRSITGIASSLEVLPSIRAAVGGKIAILIDGSFRRGSDVLKALALGAQAVLLGRPPIWALAAYGADGVQKVVEMLQTELAQDMAMCGKVNLKALDPSVVKLHRR
jgi:4-hydroxymandelate oxidase